MPRRYPEARKWYTTKEWKHLRKVTLVNNPICTRCGGVATLADHRIPHRGNYDLFFCVNGCNTLDSMCAKCHNSWKEKKENGRVDTACGEDGYPVDKNHPWNQ